VNITVVGLSHKTASLPLRERVALSYEELPRALAYVHVQAANGVILSTCNRTELYYVAEGQVSHSAALDLLAGAAGVSAARLKKHTYYYVNDAAVRHLHRVAAGLDSMIFGEVEILGQIRTGLQAASEAGLCNAVLIRLFHSAIRTGRRIHSETFVRRHDRSVASAAVTLARRVLGDITSRPVLVVGAGDAGTMAVRTLVHEGARNIVIANRTYRRAAELAKRLRVRAVSLPHLPEVIREVDLAICASASGTRLIRPAALTDAVGARKGRPIVLIDMSVPRTVDPAAADLPGVRLYDMDDLRTMCPAGPEERQHEVAKADAILEEDIQRFDSWWRSLRAVPTISALANFEEARSRELTKTLRRFPAIDDRQRESLDALTRAIVKKALHQPITHLKRHSEDQDCLAVTRALFGLD
jgi:glutamyl-tRNA reductase